jgi:hypothetical protein
MNTEWAEERENTEKRRGGKLDAISYTSCRIHAI